MCCQWISCFEWFSTQATGNGNANNMFSFNVALYIAKTSLLATHLAYPCFFADFWMWISIFTDYQHQLQLLVQILYICVVSCVICSCQHLIIRCLYKCFFKTNIFVQGIPLWHRWIFRRVLLDSLYYCLFSEGFCFLVLCEAFQLELISQNKERVEVFFGKHLPLHGRRSPSYSSCFQI